MSTTIGTPAASEATTTKKSEDEVSASPPTNQIVWKNYQKIAFRIAFVFFLIISIPAELDWYKSFFLIDWTDLHYRDIYDFCRFSTFSFVKASEQGRWGLGGFINWGVTFLVAAGIGLIWSAIDRKTINYRKLYYWIRVVVRYRAAIGIIGFGFTKLLPVQMPYPSFGLLNTDFGDFAGQKIYWMSIGIVPWYQIFAGVVEVLAGILLLFRKTTFWGASLLWSALGAIVVVNLAYDGGVHVYSAYFVLLASFLLIDDVKNVYRLLILEKKVIPTVRFYPIFEKWQNNLRFGIKSTIVFVFLILFFYLQVINFLYDPYKQPSVKGVPALRGSYNVTEFRLNNKLIPYSPLDSERWKEVTFEKWSTLTFKVNKPVQLDLSNGGGDPMRDINRTFEVSNVAGGQRVFYYDADTVNQVLYLQDKNVPTTKRDVGPGGKWQKDKKKPVDKDSIYPANWIPAKALANIGDDVNKINAKAVNTRRREAFANEKPIKARPKMILKYTTNDGSRVILRGTNENRDSIYIVLDKVNRKYLVSPSTLSAGVY